MYILRAAVTLVATTAANKIDKALILLNFDDTPSQDWYLAGSVAFPLDGGSNKRRSIIQAHEELRRLEREPD